MRDEVPYRPTVLPNPYVAVAILLRAKAGATENPHSCTTILLAYLLPGSITCRPSTSQDRIWPYRIWPKVTFRKPL